MTKQKMYRTESRFRAALKRYDAEGLLTTWFYSESDHAYIINLREHVPCRRGIKLAGLDALRDRLLSPEGFKAFMAEGKATQ